MTLDSDFTDQFPAIEGSIAAIGQKPVIGATDIAAGLLQAENSLLTSSQACAQTSQPVVVLFSDGIFNEGDDPVGIAQTMNSAAGIVIHSVTFGTEAQARQTMDDVANVAGNGLSLHADSADELIASFEQIANSIPVIVIK